MWVDDDVSGFEISMDVAFGMKDFESIKDLEGDFFDLDLIHGVCCLLDKSAEIVLA